LRIAVTSFASSLLPDVLARLREQYPEVLVEIRLQQAAVVAESLVHDRADIGLGGAGMLGRGDVIVRPCALLRYAVAVARSLVPAGAGSLCLEDLASLPILTYPEGSGERQNVSAAFSRVGLRPKIVVAGETDVLLACAEAGMGAAIVCGHRQEAVAGNRQLADFDGSRFFDDVPLWIGIRRGKLLRDFESRCIQILLPDLDLAAFQQEVLTRDVGKWEPEFSI
jgi:DNA-binding transcriptional LysR family regulator